VHDRPLIYCDDGFRGWRVVAQSTAFSDGVVVSTPLFDDDLSLFEGIEDLPIQKLVPEASIEGLAVAVLLGLGNYEAALDLIEEIISQFPKTGNRRGFKASVMGYLDKGDEAKAALDYYLKLRPNLKTKDDYKKIFVPNSSLADKLIEGLVKAGWEPEDG